MSVMTHAGPLLGLFLSLTLPQSYALAAAILVDELYASLF
jgi:hypothetical protein